MAKEIKRTPREVVERNIALLDNMMRYLLAEPHVFSALPDNFELVILPEDDPEIRLYNLELLDRLGSQGKPIVFARIKSAQEPDWKHTRPSLYVPVAG